MSLVEYRALMNPEIVNYAFSILVWGDERRVTRLAPAGLGFKEHRRCRQAIQEVFRIHMFNYS